MFLSDKEAERAFARNVRLRFPYCISAVYTNFLYFLPTQHNNVRLRFLYRQYTPTFYISICISKLPTQHNTTTIDFAFYIGSIHQLFYISICISTLPTQHNNVRLRFLYRQYTPTFYISICISTLPTHNTTFIIIKRRIFSMSRIFGEKCSKPQNVLAYHSKSPYFSIIVQLIQ